MRSWRKAADAYEPEDRGPVRAAARRKARRRLQAASRRRNRR